MKNLRTETKENVMEIDQIWDRLTTFSASRKYYFKFLGAEYRNDPKSRWNMKIMALKRLDRMLLDLRSASMKNVLMDVIRMEPEISLLCWDIPKYQKQKLQDLMNECMENLRLLKFKEKHPNLEALEDKRAIKTLPDTRKVIMLNQIQSL